MAADLQREAQRRERGRRQRIERDEQIARDRLQALLHRWEVRAREGASCVDPVELRAHLQEFCNTFSEAERAEPELQAIETRLERNLERAEAYEACQAKLEPILEQANRAYSLPEIEQALARVREATPGLPVALAKRAHEARQRLEKLRSEHLERQALEHELEAIEQLLPHWNRAIAAGDQLALAAAREAITKTDRYLTLAPGDTRAVRMRYQLRDALSQPRHAQGQHTWQRWYVMLLLVCLVGYALARGLNTLPLPALPFSESQALTTESAPVRTIWVPFTAK